MIEGRQIRAALSLLGWTYAELAEKAAVSPSTVVRATAAEGVPSINSQNLGRIELALVRAGTVFISENQSSAVGGVGVRLRD